jgi:hypothetical protein
VPNSVTNTDQRCLPDVEGDWIRARRLRKGGPERVRFMESLGPTHLIYLLLATAVIGKMCGFAAFAVTLRNRRRARRFFLLGFACGLVTGAFLARLHRARRSSWPWNPRPVAAWPVGPLLSGANSWCAALRCRLPM